MSKNECLATDFFQQPLFWFEIFSGNSLHLYLQPTLKVWIWTKKSQSICILVILVFVFFEYTNSHTKMEHN